MSDKTLRLGIIGCGFWSTYQVGAWFEVGGISIVGIYDIVKSKAEDFAKKFNLSADVVYDSAEDMLKNAKLDFVDIITTVETHHKYVVLVASYGINAICQKPMGRTYEECLDMVKKSKEANVKLFIHDNWRFQTPIRAFKSQLDKDLIGKHFRVRFTYQHSFPVFKNQPYLAELEQLILSDLGVHILDVVRFLFGNVKSLYCVTASVAPGIKGEDVATLLMVLNSGVHCLVTLSYSSPVELDRFPELFILVEGSKGSVELGPDYHVRTTVNKVTSVERFPPPLYKFIDPNYGLVHSSIVPTNKHFLEALRGNIKEPELTGEDFLKSMQLVFTSYESAKKNQIIQIDQ